MVTALIAAPIIIMTLASAVRAGVIFPQPITGTEVCSERCDRASCIEPRNCPAGLTWDRCLCCRTCARREGDRCDLGARVLKTKREHNQRATYAEAATDYASNYIHGTCGTNLECRIRTDLDPEEFPDDPSADPSVGNQMPRQPETACICTDQNPRCGSDNQTYSTLCAIIEEANTLPSLNLDDPSKKLTNLEITHVGPCHSAPIILQPIENHIATPQGTNVLFTCDVIGFPLPQIVWHLQTVDGQTRSLPDGDGRISVSSRGASRPDRVTSWLQIIQVSREHEGDYSCTVENGLGGEIQSTGRLLVSKHHVKEELMNNADKANRAGNSKEDDRSAGVAASSRYAKSRRPRAADIDGDDGYDGEIGQIVLDDTYNNGGGRGEF